MKKGYTILVEDEASMILGNTVMRSWGLRGKKITAPSFLSHKRFYMFGALSKDGFVCRFYDQTDTRRSSS